MLHQAFTLGLQTNYLGLSFLPPKYSIALLKLCSFSHAPQIAFYLCCCACEAWLCSGEMYILKLCAVWYGAVKKGGASTSDHNQSLIWIQTLFFWILWESLKWLIFPFPPLSVFHSSESFFVCQSVCRQQQGSLSADRRSMLPAESYPINHVNMLISGIYFIQQK